MIDWGTKETAKTSYKRILQEKYYWNKTTSKYYWKSPDSYAFAPAIWNLEDEFGRDNSWYIGSQIFTNFVST